MEIFVTWVKMSKEEIAWNNLISCFSYYADKDYEQSLIPANVSVESKLYSLLEKTLGNVASKKQIKNFLEDAATYSYQLNVLLPLILRYNSHLPKIDDKIRGFLNRLRSLRNDIAHRGKCKNKLTQKECAELITAALFGFRYLSIIEDKIQK